MVDKRRSVADEWGRIAEANALFEVWWNSEMAEKLYGADTFTRMVAERAALMAWHAALGLDYGGALERLVADVRGKLGRDPA